MLTNSTKLLQTIALAFTLYTLNACTNNKERVVEGLAPIYINFDSAKIIKTAPAKPLKSSGKIIQYGPNLTLQVDVGTGVHVIDCTNKIAPIRKYFIEIPGVSDISIKDDILLANNFNDLVSIEVDTNLNISKINRVANVYLLNKNVIPTVRNTFFECVDSSKGIVVGWQKKSLVNPMCRTLN